MSIGKESVASRAAGWGAQLLQFAAIVGIVFVAKGALAEPFYVPSGSMEPTLLIGDALLASKYPYGYGTASLPIQINLPETGRVFGEPPKLGDVPCRKVRGRCAKAPGDIVGDGGDLRVGIRGPEGWHEQHALRREPIRA